MNFKRAFDQIGGVFFGAGQELGLGDDGAGVSHEDLEDGVLGARQMNGGVADQDLVPCRKKSDVRAGQRAVAKALTHAQMSRDAGLEFLDVKGLGYVIDAAAGQQFDLVVNGCLGADCDDRDAGRDLREQVFAVEPRQHQIHQDEVRRRLGVNQNHTLKPVGSRNGVVAFARQFLRQDITYVIIIFDYKYSCHVISIYIYGIIGSMLGQKANKNPQKALNKGLSGIMKLLVLYPDNYMLWFESS